MRQVVPPKEQKMKLIRKQKRLLKQLSDVGPFLAGTLSTIYRICGASSCRCKKGGEKHKALYFTWKEKNKTKSLYVPVNMHEDAIAWDKNYKKMKSLISKISSVQQELLELR